MNNNFLKHPIKFNLYIDIYRVDINVYIANIATKKGLSKLRKIIPKQRKYINSQDLRGAKGQCIAHAAGCSDVYIYNADTSTPRKLASFLTTIRHEVQHAATNVFNWIEDDNLHSESFLYLNDFIYTKILAKIFHQWKRITKSTN